MKIPDGFPIRDVTRQKYYEDLGECLDLDDLVSEEIYTLRLIASRIRPGAYALDYPVLVTGVETREHEDSYPFPYLIHTVAFQPISAEGNVSPNNKQSRILESGILYSTMRLILSWGFKSGQNGYFVGSDDFDDEWSTIQLTESSDITFDPELIKT